MSNDFRTAIDKAARESGRVKFDNHMGGSMLPRGLCFDSIAVALTAAYPEVTHDQVVNELLTLEDHYFNECRERHIAEFNKRHNK